MLSVRIIILCLAFFSLSAQAQLTCTIATSDFEKFSRVSIQFSDPVTGFEEKDLRGQFGSLNDLEAVRGSRQNFKLRLEPKWQKGVAQVDVQLRIPANVVKGVRPKVGNAACGPVTVTFKRELKTAPTATPVSSLRPSLPPLEPTVIATPTETDEPEPTNTAVPTSTATSIPSVSETEVPSVAMTATVTSTSTKTPTMTSTPTHTKTNTPIPTRTPSVQSSATPTRTPTSTPTSFVTVPAGQCGEQIEVPTQSLKIFPNAEGHAALMVGGSGRNLVRPCSKIYKVTTLADSGAGSLRACIEAKGPRTCIFEVGGLIWANKELKVSNPFLTIAGQTAPSPGIVIKGSGMSIEASDVLLQHIRFRIGDDPRADCCKTSSCSAVVALTCTADPGSRDGVRIYSSKGALQNIMVDHVSIAWALDEGFSISPDKGVVSNVTFSNSIISSGLDLSIHPEASIPSDPGHSKGVLINGASRVQNLSFVKNLLAHNADRNIRISTPIRMEYINNIVYDWGRGRGVGRTIELSNSVSAVHEIDLIGNAYLPGLDTFCPSTENRPDLCFEGGQDGIDTEAERAKLHAIFRVGGGLANGLSLNSRYFLSDNLGPTRLNSSGDQWLIADKSFFSGGLLLFPLNKALSQVASSNMVDIMSTTAAYNSVLNESGARPAARDSVDTATINDVSTQTGRIINCVSNDGTARCAKNAGGWPNYPTVMRALTVPANPDGDDDGDGYTNLEEFLVGFSEEVE